jgi:hypothetical protein
MHNDLIVNKEIFVKIKKEPLDGYYIIHPKVFLV